MLAEKSGVIAVTISRHHAQNEAFSVILEFLLYPIWDFMSTP
jgi:hypothetical protein